MALEAQDYKKMVKALRCCAMANGDCETECPYYDHAMCTDEVKFDAAAAIEALQAEAGQWKAAVKGQEDGIKVLQAEVERLQEKLCDWCAVCPKERRNPDDCELLGENTVMYVPSGAKMEVQE